MQENTLTGWKVVWWLFKLLGFPIAVPWLIYHFVDIMIHRHRKSSLNGKVVIITGASSGLGEALAHVFYSSGCKLILISRRREELERVKNALMNTHQTVPTYPPTVLPLDLTDIISLKSHVSEIIETHGTIDILINNAGISYRGEAMNTNVDVDIRIMLINYFAQIALAKAVLPHMVKQQHGHIVCVSSIQGKIAIPYRSAYAASKHALEAWCDSCRAELADENIKITVISPGYIKTSLSLNALTETGQFYGVMDKTTEQGYSSKYVADCVLKAVLKGEKDVIISPFAPRCAVFLRILCPSLYFWIMNRRARSPNKDK